MLSLFSQATILAQANVYMYLHYRIINTIKQIYPTLLSPLLVLYVINTAGVPCRAGSAYTSGAP